MADLPFSFDVEPVEGWRAYRLVEFARHGGVSEHRLTALVHTAPGVPPRAAPQATCHINHHEAPVAQCSCGHWALRSEASALVAANHYRATIVAKVKLWGRLVEHRDGWRAQHAYPTMLLAYGATAEEAAGLERVYGVPVQIRELGDVQVPLEEPAAPPPAPARCNGFSVNPNTWTRNCFLTIERAAWDAKGDLQQGARVALSTGKAEHADRLTILVNGQQCWPHASRIGRSRWRSVLRRSA